MKLLLIISIFLILFIIWTFCRISKISAKLEIDAKLDNKIQKSTK